MNKTQVISLLVTLGATANTIYGFLQNNSGILTDFGIAPKWGQIIMLIGLVATALSTSLAAKK